MAGVMAFPPTFGWFHSQHSQSLMASSLETPCEPTPPDMLGPFYKSDAPVRDWVGYGYTLRGKVLSVGSCTPLVGARIEFWLAGPNGLYGDEYRATMFSREDGFYRFMSHFPPPYSSRSPHIHIRVTAPGYEELVTQHYPERGTTAAQFPLVLSPKS